MVKEPISRLVTQCGQWREQLRELREEFSHYKQSLQNAASSITDHTQLQQVEHLHNQLHLQLINIHDMKQLIKAHERKVDYEKSTNNRLLADETHAGHLLLKEQYAELLRRLEELRAEFNHFMAALKEPAFH